MIESYILESIRLGQNLLGLHEVKHAKAIDDASAFVYYGSFGLLDPKAPFVDAPAIMAATGTSYPRALLMASGIGFLTMGAIGWAIDPADKREGGYAESDWWQRNITENQWQIGTTDYFWE